MPDSFNRPPRIQPELPTGEINIPNPPSVNVMGGRLSLVTMVLPLITVLTYALIGGRTRNPLYLLPMGLSVIMMSFVGLMTWRRSQRNEATKQANYKQILFNLRDKLQKSHDQQQIFYNHNYPDLNRLIQMANTLDSRLWERRTGDGDFAALRMGIGLLPSTVIAKPPSNENTDAPQLPAALKLADEFSKVRDVPIPLPLRHAHAVGIAGRDYQPTAAFTRAILVSYAALHAPTDARLYIIGSPETEAQWQWASWLPHTNTSRNEQGAGDQLSFKASRIRRTWDGLQAELERRQVRLAENNKQESFRLPFLVVVIDLFTSQPNSPQEVETEAAVSLLLKHGRELGAAVIFMVPDYRLIPSECVAVIDVEPSGANLVFRYAEVGVNTTRRDGWGDTIDVQRAEYEFARKLAPLALRSSYGADLPLALSLLDLFGNPESIDKLPVAENWRKTRAPNSNWPEVPIGVMLGGRIRNLVFSAAQDGIHGLIAGTTGSGKSELLMTIITGLAVRYDPSIVNFVLVDYKGGTAFDAFRKLPHTVDVITNLQGQAGARMFTAIRAELNRRAKILADANSKDIAAYRGAGLHLKQPLPHLFVIIDEFAEMIKEMPEFKAQLDSIARLGRALGVHLILATQRPSGVVSDQIRANMKFRICLRVETPDDSRELLRRTDAAFLPANIPGRAYIQVGNENVELIQVARAAAPYQGRQVDTTPAVIWHNRQVTGVQNAAAQSRESTAQIVPLTDVLIQHTAALASEDKNVHIQPKPWPDPLPERLLLEDVNPALRDWYDDEGQWRGAAWGTRALKAVVGLVDNPAQAEQLPLELDLARGHLVVFGAGGWGKTTLLRAIITSLIATHSPAELQLYLLDFGGRGLAVFDELPHTGAIITPPEGERVLRLLRKLNNVLEDRKTVLSQAHADNLVDYNRDHPQAVLPAFLVIVDNFAEFRENFADELDNFTGLAREGRAYGIHLVIAAEQVTAIPPKLYSQFTERLTLRLADSTEYSSVVGRGVPDMAEIPGRGFVRLERTPLEFQVALPIQHKRHAVNGADDRTELEELADLAHRMAAAWTDVKPESIDILRPVILLKDILRPAASRRVESMLGMADLDLNPVSISLRAQGPHFVVVGPPLSGKTTALRTWVLSLTTRYTPDQAAFCLVDFQRRFFEYGGQHKLSDIPHVLGTASETPELEALAERLLKEFEARRADSTLSRPDMYIIVDNYEDIGAAVGMSGRALFTKIGELARKYGNDGLHFIIGGSLNILRTGDDLIKHVTGPRFGLGLDASESPTALGARIKGGASEFPPGRGYLVKSGRASLIQVATPETDNREEALDNWVHRIQDACNGRRAAWFDDHTEEGA